MDFSGISFYYYYFYIVTNGHVFFKFPVSFGTTWSPLLESNRAEGTQLWIRFISSHHVDISPRSFSIDVLTIAPSSPAEKEFKLVNIAAVFQQASAHWECTANFHSDEAIQTSTEYDPLRRPNQGSIAFLLGHQTSLQWELDVANFTEFFSGKRPLNSQVSILFFISTRRMKTAINLLQKLPSPPCRFHLKYVWFVVQPLLFSNAAKRIFFIAARRKVFATLL